MTMIITYKKARMVKDLQGNEKGIKSFTLENISSVSKKNGMITIITKSNLVASYRIEDLEMFVVVDYYGN